MRRAEVAKRLSVYRGYISELERNHVGRIRTVAGARRTTTGTMAEEERKACANFPAAGSRLPRHSALVRHARSSLDVAPSATSSELGTEDIST
jgi:hypothetical protein